MNTIMKKMILSTAIALAFGVTSASAQIYVSVHPTHAVVVRTAPPSPRHVWVDEEWRPVHGHYEYVGGYWAAPPRYGMVWVPGHWRDTRRGAYWIPGHWR